MTGTGALERARTAWDRKPIARRESPIPAHGKQIGLSIGQAAPLEPVLSVTGWSSAMRDLSPVTAFDEKHRGSFASGESVELKGTWSNTQSHTVAFPNEMCAVLGYFTSDASGDVMCIDTLH